MRIDLANDREQCGSQTIERPQIRLDLIEVVILLIYDCAILVKMDDADGYSVKLLIHLFSAPQRWNLSGIVIGAS